MKANELQIGDYVNYRGQIIKVTSLYDKGGSNEVGWSDIERVWVNASNVEPIPLTPEILEKNGFENGKLNISPQYYLEDNDVFIGVTLKDIPDKHKGIDIAKGRLCFQYDISYIKEPIYVHQLQHALRLCGIEKEIKL